MESTFTLKEIAVGGLALKIYDLVWEDWAISFLLDQSITQETENYEKENRKKYIQLIQEAIQKNQFSHMGLQSFVKFIPKLKANSSFRNGQKLKYSTMRQAIYDFFELDEKIQIFLADSAK
jgi:hypothetical protein